MCTSTAEILKTEIIAQNQEKSTNLYIYLTFVIILVITNISAGIYKSSLCHQDKTDLMRLTWECVKSPQCIETNTTYSLSLVSLPAYSASVALHIEIFLWGNPVIVASTDNRTRPTALGGCRSSLSGNTLRKIMPKFRVPGCYPRYIRNRSSYP